MVPGFAGRIPTCVVSLHDTTRRGKPATTLITEVVDSNIDNSPRYLGTPMARRDIAQTFPTSWLKSQLPGNILPVHFRV